MAKDKFDLRKLKDDIPEYPAFLDTRMEARLIDAKAKKGFHRKKLISLTSFASAFLVIFVSVLLIEPWNLIDKGLGTVSEPNDPGYETSATTEDDNIEVPAVEDELTTLVFERRGSEEINVFDDHRVNHLFSAINLSTAFVNNSHYLLVDYSFGHDVNVEVMTSGFNLTVEAPGFNKMKSSEPVVHSFLTDEYKTEENALVHPLLFTYEFVLSAEDELNTIKFTYNISGEKEISNELNISLALVNDELKGV